MEDAADRRGDDAPAIIDGEFVEPPVRSGKDTIEFGTESRDNFGEAGLSGYMPLAPVTNINLLSIRIVAN